MTNYRVEVSNQGDYAGLYRRARTPLSRLRQAGVLILCCVVSFGMSTKNAIAINAKHAVVGGLSAPERISIRDRSDDAQIDSSLAKCVHIGFGDTSVQSRGDYELPSWSQSRLVHIWPFFWKRGQAIAGHYSNYCPLSYSISGGLPKILYANMGDGSVPYDDSIKISPVNHYISTQLPPRSFVRAVYQSPSCNKQSECKQHKEGVSDFEAVPQERRPELGSLIVAMLGILIAWFIASRGDDLRDSGRRMLGGICLLIGLLLCFECTVGFMLGIDIWSLGRLCWSLT